MGDMNFSLTTFNKTGKLMQIEYALARVAQGKMSLGIKATNGVVIASDKKVSSVLVDAEEYQKIQSITPSTGMSSQNTFCIFSTGNYFDINHGLPLFIVNDLLCRLRVLWHGTGFPSACTKCSKERSEIFPNIS